MKNLIRLTLLLLVVSFSQVTYAGALSGLAHLKVPWRAATEAKSATSVARAATLPPSIGRSAVINSERSAVRATAALPPARIATSGTAKALSTPISKSAIDNGIQRLSTAAPLPKPNVVAKSGEKWIRTPSSIQDKMTLEAAQNGAGRRIIKNLEDTKFKGMEKFQYKVKSIDGKDSVVHYVKDNKTGDLMDFKFKKRSTDSLGSYEKNTNGGIRD